MTQGNRRLLRRIGLTLVVLTIAMVYLFPYTWLVLTGFRRTVDTLALPPRLVFEPSLDGFRYILSVTGFQWYVLNSLIVATSATFATLALAAPAAYALAHLRLRAKTFLYGIIVFRMVPAISIVVPAYLIAVHLRQLDTYQILIAIYTAANLPFAIWMLRSFFREVPSSLREAAIIDGCSEFGVFRRMIVPISMGGIVATGVFVFIAAWNEFLFALVLTNSYAPTGPLAMLNFRTQWGVQWDAIGAAAVMLSTPVIVFAVAMQRYLIRGMTMGSVK